MDCTDTSKARAARHLAAIDHDWARLVSRVGPYRQKRRKIDSPFQALVHAVAHQQLHGKAADAILARLIDLYPRGSYPEPRELLDTPREQLLACGFSRRKADTILGLAEATRDGLVPDMHHARTLSDQELIERLVTLPGIGRWTVEMLLMQTLGRPDIMPVDDFGVRRGYQRMKALDAMPSPAQLRRATAPCSPYRTAAAWYLWRSVDLPRD